MVTASGCGATIKDYGAMFADDPAYAEKAARVAALAKDPSEYLSASISRSSRRAQTVAYHPACSLQHGTEVLEAPKALLRRAGYEVRDAGGGASLLRLGGSLQHPATAIADQLRDRKVRNLARLKPDVIATGNIGCMTQIGSASRRRWFT